MSACLDQPHDPLLVVPRLIEMLATEGLQVLVLRPPGETRQLPLRMELDRLHVAQVVEQVLVA
jgi:hypothetical protein